MQEVSFWLNLERALANIKEKRESVEIELTMDVLKQGKRFHATVSFDQDTGLQKAIDMVTNYNPLMKDFPLALNALLTAADNDQITTALVDIFSHLKKIRTTLYPIPRALKLVLAISRDLNMQLLKVLGNSYLMHTSHEDFERIIAGCRRVFEAWEQEDEQFRNILRDMIKRRRDDMKTFRRVNPEHSVLKERLDQLGKFRKQHEQLRSVIGRVLRPSGTDETSSMLDVDDANAIEEVNLAYEDVKQVDALDLTDAGTLAWQSAQKKYDERIDRVETRITSKLRDQLGTAKNANEMFRIFGKFNALFVRPRIKGAIREYQAQLIERVKEDIEALHRKFKVQYARTMNSHMSGIRDLPPVSGQIIWARQIDRQLSTYLQRVANVLGTTDWQNHKEGRSLKEDGDSFRRKLDTQVLFDKWSQEVQQRQIGVTGRIFDIELRRGVETALVLSINFHSQIITLSKEVRNLKWLGFRVPLVIVNKALQANHLYPFAISLKASTKTYQQTLEKLEANPGVSNLVASYHKAIQMSIAEGVTLRWESYRLETYVQKLAEEVFTFQDKVDDLLVYNEKLHELVSSLDTCKLERETLRSILTAIQKIVDDLNLKSYVNLELWVKELDRKIEARLVVRLGGALTHWLVALHEYGDKDSDWDARDSGLTTKEIRVSDLPAIEPMTHEILIRNQQMILNPPIEKVRENLFSQLQSHLSVITDIPRIQTSQYAMGLHTDELDKSKLTYRGLLTQLSNAGAELIRAYQVVDEQLTAVKSYVQIWLQYQSLWDMQTDVVVTRLGDDLALWQQLLVEIKKARRTFDTSETSKQFGPVIINFSQVQNKVNLKYDQLHKEILSKFASRLGGSVEEFFGAISKARSELESQSVDSASTQDAVGLVTLLQGLKRKIAAWGRDLELFEQGEKVLERQRYTFPDEWRQVDSIVGEWDAFNSILSRKDGQIQGSMGQLQMKVVDEDRQIEKRISELCEDWDRNKPVGNLSGKNSESDQIADQAMNTLSIYEGRFTAVKLDFDELQKAKVALDLGAKNDERLEPRLEEARDLKSSWSELSRIFTLIRELKATAWATLNPRNVKKSLDNIINEMRNLPARVRSYASYESTMAQVTEYKSTCKLIEALRSDGLKERHWKQIMKGLRVTFLLSDLTLGKLWDADLNSNKKIVEDVLQVAQGELALEKFIAQTREEWNGYLLDLVNFRNQTKLIKGWVELFDKCRERLSSIMAMKLSPYYKSFAEEAQGWDDKLNRVLAVFEVWMDVQQRWVHLSGIFQGSADIKHLLPSESARFQSISTEFLGLMKKVSQSPLVLEVIAIPNVQKALDRLQDLLKAIEKALHEYLEKERASFPRFYFIGDDALLEIIGNSKDVDKLQKHFRKLFAGVHSIEVDDASGTIRKVLSKEGEEVELVTPVPFSQSKITKWLTDLEKEVSVSLATQLAKSAAVAKSFNESFEPKSYMKWIDDFQCQIVTLTAQIWWSESVDGALKAEDDSKLKDVLHSVEERQTYLADTVLLYQPPIRRRKLEHLITEMVHQRDVIRDLLSKGIKSNKDFEWLSQMRFYFDPKGEDVLTQLSINLASAEFFYGFEYLGITDKLVQTQLTDRAYLTLTQGLKYRQGGAPFGPAGTGKTESVKMLGGQLGRFVLVFNCDETFDSSAMERILVGLCHVGAWGCFDEFNRLEEAQLSAVSQQIQTIQSALTLFGEEGQSEKVYVEVIPENRVPLSPDVGIFVTMNPGYAGRSELPDNLKKLFRQLAMTKPDMELIAQVMLFSQGFRTAEPLSKKVVPLFTLCQEQLSQQSHYDFGLRALKAVLITAGGVKREQLERARKVYTDAGKEIDEAAVANSIDEQIVLIQSITETIVPKLVADDIPLLGSLLSDVFPGVEYKAQPPEGLQAKLMEVLSEQHLVASDVFMTKIMQLYGVLCINHGLMMVGPSGAGKTTAWSVLLEALRRYEGKQAMSYVIDPKAITKDELYGFLDQTTREWTDGVFTSILRKICDNRLGELDKRQWVIFDGDVDPEWVENLNSVLDDNKLLTLPNGERLALPPCLRVMFEVQDLKNATQATVSRCGMIWFSEETLSLDDYFSSNISKLKSMPINGNDGQAETSLSVQRSVMNALEQYFRSDSLVGGAMKIAQGIDHIMDYTQIRVLTSLFAMVKNICRKVLEYNEAHEDFPMSEEQIISYGSKRLVYYLMWCLVGDTNNKVRAMMSDHIKRSSTIPLPPLDNGEIIIDYQVLITGEWAPWDVPVVDFEMERIASGTDAVVPTLDTERHVDLMTNWLQDHLPVVLCGPPGSGKTMTLFNALKDLPEYEPALLNFSSSSSPEMVLETLHQYCEYRRTPAGTVLAPIQPGKWLVVFCDEINLPAADKYDTVRVITFLRQLVEKGGFWRPDKLDFVFLERIQFVGACNPPTDPGRVPLSHRFLRHVPVIYVDYPSALILSVTVSESKSLIRFTKSSETMTLRTLDQSAVFFPSPSK